MFIGIAPGKDEWENTKKPFTGPAGRLLDATLEAVEWDPEDGYRTNLVCDWNDAPSHDEIALCLPRLRQEILTVKPRVMVLLGEIVIDAFGLLREYKKTLFGIRGAVLWNEKYNCWMIPTYHPAAFLHERSKKSASRIDIVDMAKDLKKIYDVVTWPVDGSYKPWEIEYKLVENAEEADSILWSLSGDVAIDVETSYDGKVSRFEEMITEEQRAKLPSYANGKLLCFSVTSGEGTWTFPGYIMPEVTKGWGARTEVEWTMQLGLFDKAKVRGMLGEVLEIKEDTLLQSYSLDERGGQTEEGEVAVGVHGLKGNSAQYLGTKFYDVDVLKATPEQLFYYNAQDTTYTRRLMHKFKQMQIDDNVRGFYEDLLIPGANALSEIQDYGCYMDMKVMNELLEEWIPDWMVREVKLQEDAHALGWPEDKELNFRSSPQMQAFVYDYLKAPYTDEGRTTKNNVLEKLAEETGIQWLQDLKEFRQLGHMISTYGDGIMDDIKQDGLIHSEPLIHGSRGGRLSYHKPPIQTIPNRGVDPSLARLRRLFKARPPHMANGRKMTLIEADLKQAELWATWMYSGDEALLAALESGDVHGATALEVFDTTEDNEFFYIHRYMTKVISFGILYGRGPKSFSEDMWKGHPPPPGIPAFVWSVQEAKDYIARWFKKYPRVAKWRKEVQAEAYRNGEQVSYTGRKRRYWLTDYQVMAQSVNYGPQSLAHDYLFKKLIRLHKLLGEYNAHILYEVHDALVIEADVEWLPQTLNLIKRVMEEPEFGMERGIPVDVAVGPNWLDTKKVKYDDNDMPIIPEEVFA